MGKQPFEPFSAMQYLAWAIEEINKIGHPQALTHARKALAELRLTQREAEAMLIVIRDNQWPQKEARNDHG